MIVAYTVDVAGKTVLESVFQMICGNMDVQANIPDLSIYI
ncbi:protein of unknown function [Tenacibaculum sp. 190524A02b]